MSRTQETAVPYAAPLPVTPPTYVQAFLYQSAGVYYHSVFCCDCTDPHWGVVGASSQLSNNPCGGSPGGAAEQYTKVPVANLPSSSPEYTVGLMDNVSDNLAMGMFFPPLPRRWQMELFPSGTAVTLNNDQTAVEASIDAHLFSVNFFKLSFPNPCGGSPVAPLLSVTFGVADRCRSAAAGETTTTLNLDNGSLVAAGVPGEPLALYGAVTQFNGGDVPLMIVARP